MTNRDALHILQQLSEEALDKPFILMDYFGDLTEIDQAHHLRWDIYTLDNDPIDTDDVEELNDMINNPEKYEDFEIVDFVERLTGIIMDIEDAREELLSLTNDLKLISSKGDLYFIT